MKYFIFRHKIVIFMILSLMLTGCSSGKQEVKWQPAQSTGQQSQSSSFNESDFSLFDFNKFEGGKVPADMLGDKLKIKVSYVGVAPGFKSGNYSPDRFITYLVGKPINTYMAKNPMRGPRGHVFAVIENQRAMEIFTLPSDKNFFIYGEIVRLGESGGGEFGVKTIRLVK